MGVGRGGRGAAVYNLVLTSIRYFIRIYSPYMSIVKIYTFHLIFNVFYFNSQLKTQIHFIYWR
jgi:hypothetical protein